MFSCSSTSAAKSPLRRACRAWASSAASAGSVVTVGGSASGVRGGGTDCSPDAHAGGRGTGCAARTAAARAGRTNTSHVTAAPSRNAASSSAHIWANSPTTDISSAISRFTRP